MVDFIKNSLIFMKKLLDVYWRVGFTRYFHCYLRFTTVIDCFHLVFGFRSSTTIGLLKVWQLSESNFGTTL